MSSKEDIILYALAGPKLSVAINQIATVVSTCRGGPFLLRQDRDPLHNLKEIVEIEESIKDKNYIPLVGEGYLKGLLKDGWTFYTPTLRCSFQNTALLENEFPIREIIRQIKKFGEVKVSEATWEDMGMPLVAEEVGEEKHQVAELEKVKIVWERVSDRPPLGTGHWWNRKMFR